MNANSTGSASTPGIPPDANVYTFATGASWVFLFAMLMAFAEAVLLFYRAWTTPDPSTRITQIPEGVFFALVAELNWRFLRTSSARIAVNETGIWRRQGRGTDFLSWNDVTSVRTNDTLQRLEITDRHDLTTIRVEYQVGNFERLRDYILSQTTQQAQLEKVGMNVFHAVSDNKMIYGAVAATLLFFAYLSQHHSGHVLVVPLLLGVVLLFFVLREPTKVVIGHDGIAIHHIGYQSDIPFNSIANVSIVDVRFHGNVWPGVVITTIRGARTRLTRFREGSVAVYEAIQAARGLAGVAQSPPLTGSVGPGGPANAPQPAANRPVESTLSSSSAPSPQPAGTPLSTPSPSSAIRRRNTPAEFRSIGVAFGTAMFTALAMFGGLGKTKIGRALDEAIASRLQSAPEYPMHQGPAASLNQLKGSGTVYLVQMGSHNQPYSLADFAKWLRQKYSIDVQILPAMAVDPFAWDAKRHQYVAEQLCAQIKQRHPDLAQNRNAFLIGFTDADMYSVNTMWSSTFTQRDGLRTAIISSEGMSDTPWQAAHLSAAAANDRFRDRMRRILLKDVAILYWHLEANDDPSSLLHNPLDPDLPVDDIFESDLDPALSPNGVRVFEPCLYFIYSDKDGIAPFPGPVIRGCGEVQDPMQDESVEVFEVVLRLGLFIDKHTDIYLPDTIPIQFQRANRDGGYGKQPFGSGGGDYYDEVLGSADNIHVFREEDDGTRYDMVRKPEWLPVLGLVKYVGGEEAQAYVPGAHGGSYQTVWQYQLAWHELPYEQYDLQRFNGETKTFLPCGSVPGLDCLLVDYHDSQGRELKIDRDKLRRLTRVTSPNGKWVGVGTDDDRRILAIDDSNNRTVLYGYDSDHNLSSVTYPSGEIYRYTHDDTHHILSVAVSADANSEPRVVLRNEYQNQMLTRMTLPDGGVYTIAYDSADRMALHHVTVRTPDGRAFNLAIGDAWATVYEAPALPSAAHR
jgi:YD repeat-containing protein